MRHLPLTAALVLLAVPFIANVAPAQDRIDLSGMDCNAQAIKLREVIDNNETQADEIDRLKTDVTTALTECRNGDEQALMEVAGHLEGREWNLDVDRDG